MATGFPGFQWCQNFVSEQRNETLLMSLFLETYMQFNNSFRLWVIIINYKNDEIQKFYMR